MRRWSAAASLKRLRRGGTKHAVLGIVLATLLVLAGLALVLLQAIERERKSAFSDALNASDYSVLQDEVRVRTLLATLDSVMVLLRKEYQARPRMTQADLLARLYGLPLFQNEMVHVSISDADGNVVLTTARNSAGRQINIRDRDYFQRQKQAQEDLLEVGQPVVGRFDGSMMVPVTRRIVAPDGGFLGLINMVVDPLLFSGPIASSRLQSDVSRALFGMDGYSRMVLKDGEIVYGGDVRRAQLYKEIENSRAGSYTATAPYDGIRRIVSYRVIDPYGVVISAATDESAIEQRYAGKVRDYALAALLFAALLMALSSMLISAMVRQRRLLESEKSFHQLIEQVPQLVLTLDTQGHITWVNDRMVQYVGPADTERHNFDWVLAAVHPDDLEMVKAFNAAAMENIHHEAAIDHRKRRFDGEYRWFSANVGMVANKHGEPSYFLKTLTDIHDRKMAEERTRIAQRIESIGQLTGGMAHDFNNLLAVILGNLELLSVRLKGGDGHRQLQVAMSAAMRGAGLVKSLLALASRQPLLPSAIELGALVQRLEPLLRHAVGQRIELALRLPSEPVQVTVDEAGLEAALLNLCVNARDAMPEGGHIQVRVTLTSAMARIAVQDNGTGMPESVRKRATEPFFTTKEHGRGTGLGLAMVAGFVKQSSGTLQIDSTEGLGTTIEIVLPRTPTTPAALPTSAGHAPRPCKGSGPWRVLVVDDEPEMAELLRTWLREEGHTVVLASTADDALTLLSVREFDFMVTDIVMGGTLDGIGLAERAQAEYPNVKILLMSGYSLETATSRAEVPWPLLVKPFAKTELTAAMVRACQG